MVRMMPDLNVIREWLIANGKTPEELDNVSEPPVLADIGQALTLSLQNDDNIGMMLVAIMQRQDSLEARIAKMEGGQA